MAQWEEVGFDSHALLAIGPADFEVVDTSVPVVLTYDCVRNGLQGSPPAVNPPGPPVTPTQEWTR